MKIVKLSFALSYLKICIFVFWVLLILCFMSCFVVLDQDAMLVKLLYVMAKILFEAASYKLKFCIMLDMLK